MSGPFSRKHIQFQRKQYIIQITKEILREKGYLDTSMDEIAAKVGISKVTLYKHFKSKEDLVYEIVASEMELILKGLDEQLNSNTQLLEKLEIIFEHGYRKFFRKESFILLSIFTNQEESLAFLKNKRKEMLELEQKLKARIIPLFEEGQQQGIIDQQVPASILFISVLSIFFLIDIHKEQSLTEDELVSIAKHLYMKAIRA